MDRKLDSGTVLDGAEEQTNDTGEQAGAKDQTAELAPLYDRVEQALKKHPPADALANNDRPVAAVLADLTPDATDALYRRARAAATSQLIGARANISMAFQNAPKAFADTRSYAGVMPKPEDFAYVFGVEEGRRQLAKFDQSLEMGKQAFDMRVMSARDINSQLLDAAVGAANSPEGQSRYRVAAAAAQHVLEARQNDPAGEAIKAFPQAKEAWHLAADQGWRDPAAVQNALALTIATQRHLGMENAQPVPQSVLKDLGALPPQDRWAGMNGLLAGTTDPALKTAMSRQFAGAGLLGGQAQTPGATIVGPMAAQDQLDFETTQALPESAAGGVADQEAKLASLFGTLSTPADREAMLRHLLATSSARTETSAVDRTRRESIVDPRMMLDVPKAVELGLVNTNQVENYIPTLRDKVGGFLVGDTKPDSVWRNIARSFVGSEGGGEEGLSVADITPIGALFAGDQALTSALYGNYGDAALNALGAVPADRLAFIGLKQAGKIASPLVEKVPRVLKWSDELGEGAEALIPNDSSDLAKSADEVLPDVANRNEGVDDLFKPGLGPAPEAASGEAKTPTGQFYSVVFETKLDPALYPGFSRPNHFQAANEALLVLMEREPDFAKILREGGISLQRTKRGLVPRTAPPGYTWHHADEPGVMQLVPRYQHDLGTIFQKTLHPDRRGGFSIWGK
ncbi:HNH endonuclease [Mesorhizobium sp. B2-8-5]|uniref:HNH endonuclease n=1 Tax=Mesorhizobium sp. B2-8-5 TaxID=2589903 RepID=UPI00112E7382|nr:HNH endonuclease [Mesorhizobium sp. B2-8-5]UCI24606.1 HNH endonuclease [Mesorhizobium sp. B2-8-5]